MEMVEAVPPSGRPDDGASMEAVLRTFKNDAEAIVLALRQDGNNLGHVQCRYVVAALLIISGYCKKQNGKPNYAAAARTAGAPKRIESVKDWVKRIETRASMLLEAQHVPQAPLPDIESLLKQFDNESTESFIDQCMAGPDWQELSDALLLNDPRYCAIGDEAARSLLERALSIARAPPSTEGPAMRESGRESPELRTPQSREAQVQQRSVGVVGRGDPPQPDQTFSVVDQNERSIFLTTTAHGIVSNPHAILEDGVPIGVDAEPIKWLDAHARVVYISFPEEGYFRSVTPAQQEELKATWRAVDGIVVDAHHHRDVVILELPRVDEPRLADGTPLLRALRFAAANTLEGKKDAVAVFGYGQSGGRQSGTNITWGNLSSIDTVRGYLRTTAPILSGHSGGPLVVAYTNSKGHPDFAAIGYSVSSIDRQLGNCLPIANVQEALRALGLPQKKLVKLPPGDVMSLSSTSAAGFDTSSEYVVVPSADSQGAPSSPVLVTLSMN